MNPEVEFAERYIGNAAPKPFIWTKTAEEILDTLAACCRRISDSGQQEPGEGESE
jgi:hypothetical protein